MKALESYFSLERWDIAALVLRVGMGIMFMVHGWPKLAGGPDKWAKYGEKMELFGIAFAPEFWGFMAGFAEVGGGILLILGLFTRAGLSLLIITMIVAAVYHIDAGDGIKGASHAIEAGITFVALFILGPGRASLDEKIKG